MMITLQGHAAPWTGPLSCPVCAQTEEFVVQWLGDLTQSFTVDPTTRCREYDSHDNEGDQLNCECRIVCAVCDAVCLERPVTVVVGDWTTPNGPLPPTV
jgi:hypothetical protein